MINRIKIHIQECIEVEVESEELCFTLLKHEAIELLNIAKKNILRSEINQNEVV